MANPVIETDAGLRIATGCLVLGTFITEWTGGAKLCERFLASEDSVRITVQSLVAIARHYTFDGYLINIENAIMPEQLHNLQLFLRLLTEMMRASATFSRVLWYDSVTGTGKLSWQNKLNELNRIWYDNCDGIYLNYNWDDEMLLSSADFGALNKIFVGIDGNYDHTIFGFWKKLALYTPARPILQLPISTNFCAGFTKDAEGYSFAQPIPMKNGGVLLRKGSCTRLFCFDVHCSGCRITARASRDVGLIVNDTLTEGTRDGTSFTVTIRGAFHLHSLHVATDVIHTFQKSNS
ncbi:glycosyl hydrolase family 85 [Ancylostoma ceylanicum]|uniref:Glycosyl hydrolase family 85 n=1 Tax=Ancylostoma ceylanicum TaxID=53326 RepID=A0A0D6LWM1_9BILA|nr:glycosyl hydrolase family 85 [Ancylostoma ceylanicum]